MASLENKGKEESTASVPNTWEPVPGQILVTEEIQKRLKAEDREKQAATVDINI